MGLAEKLGFGPLSGGYSETPVATVAEIPGLQNLASLGISQSAPGYPVMTHGIPGVTLSAPQNSKTAPVNENTNRHFSPEQESVLKLLADDFLPVTVANTLGISESAISQYLAQDAFRDELARRKQKTLVRFKEMDDAYDRVEGKLLEKLENNLIFFQRPGEIVSALEKVNKMRRRVGAASQSGNTQVSQVVNITMPTVFVQKFVTTKEGHVVGLDNKSLVTIPSNALVELSAKHLPEEPSVPLLPTPPSK